ncbi:polymerase [Durania virus]|uniref:RNA-directed RNA polymerase L n=1 Tax=Durania virus TaxID=1006585 RepID=F4ZCK8_9VIRU|nr:polymerase [Durania virus]AEB70976.1 polymerase [Durania virus]
MNEILQNQPNTQEQYLCKALAHYDDEIFGLAILDYSLREDNGSVVIDFDMASRDEFSTIGSTVKNQVSLSPQELPNFVHNFTFGHLADNTDTPFISMFPAMGDGFDHLTPDLVLRVPSGRTHVIEFSTFRGTSQGSYQSAMLKIGKYESACECRSRIGPITFSVMSVHRYGVWTNLDLDEESVNELVYRFRLAISIFEEMKVLYPELSLVDEELSKTEREVLGVVSTIRMDWGRTEATFPHFKREMFEGFRSSDPDLDYISGIITKCVNNSETAIRDENFYNLDSSHLRIQKNSEVCETAISDYISEMGKEDLRDVNDPKSTVQIPAWVTMQGPEGKDLTPLKALEVTGEHPMQRIWSKVCTSASLELIDRMVDDPESELQNAISGSRERSDERSRYHRVVVDLDQTELEYAATLGVGGKKYRDHHSVKESRVRSKKGFSLEHNTKSLERFIKGGNQALLEEGSYYCPLLEDMPLRIEAQRIHQPTLTREHGENEFVKNHRLFMESPLGSWTQMVSLIGAELSASVKQHVKAKSFIVKRLLGSGIYLLIKPTNSKSHIFVSYALDKNYWCHDLSRGTEFKQYLDSGDLFITEFTSYKLSKLTNLCKCCSLTECSLSFWTEAYHEKPWESMEVARADRQPEIMVMMKYSLMTLLEDKARTEELQTMLRYVVMEGFVSQPELPRPQKMLGKLPRVLRSELQVLLMHRVLASISRIAANPFHLRKTDGCISWTGLFNPLSGSKIQDLQPLISCCYNGYFKNKEEDTEPSALSAMYKKIIELEHLKPDSDRFLGWEDPSDPKTHEFSRSYIKEICNHGKAILKRIYGQSIMQQIDDQITREVSSLTIERLATLKATSNFDENWYIYKDCKDKNYTRDKLLVKMSQFASEGKTLAIEKFEDCMTAIEERGAMHVCLFKKQQHGGLREIYVMGAEERVVQALVECIAKTVGKFFSSDTLCNPNNKSRIPESHAHRARKHCRSSVWTCATSDDAKKWNQGHFVTKFALMLCEFTSPKWWPIIIRGCSMFTRKYMMMNMRYLDILNGHRELKVDDDFVMTLFLAYHGELDVPWLERGRTYLQTTTGMMQGILHSTSSLLHTLHQEFIRSLSFKIFNLKVSPDMGSRVVCDVMQGSDDSSMIISFPACEDSVFTKCKLAAAMCFRVKKTLGLYAGIYPSEKSTSNTDFVMEYNSEFFFHSSHVRPLIRWIASCCSLPEVETLVARQEEASNLLTSISEGGGSFGLTAMIQQSQCTLHYQLVGMGVSSVFPHYRKALSRWKDPGLGFFLLDNPFAAGLGGFRFNLFKAITMTELQKVYAYFMKKVKEGTTPDDDGVLVPESCSVSPGGAIIMSSSLKWGSRKKFAKLRDRLNIPDDWIDKINHNPQLLYRAPKSGEEIILRIAEKVHSPGVVSSLSTGNAVCKVMASSVYFLSAAIFEDSGKPEFSYLDNSKYSLLQKMIAYDGFTGSHDIDPEDILFLFPNVEELEQLDQIVFDKARIELSERVSSREATQSKIMVFDEKKCMRVSPEKLVSDKWFGTQKSKIGRSAFETEWAKLTRIIRWLKDTPDETMRSSPLSNQIQIRNFFARLEGRTRTVRVTGAPVKKRSGMSKLALVIRDNFCKTGHLKGIEDISGSSRSSSVEILRHILFSILQGPYSDDSKLDLCIKALSLSTEIELRDQDGKTKANVLSILQSYIWADRGVMRKIESAGAGTVGGFVKPQKSYKDVDSIKYYGHGVWRGMMDGVDVQIDIDNKKGSPPQITSVRVAGTKSPWLICQSLKVWSDDMGVKNSADFSSTCRKNPKFWLSNFKMFGGNHPLGAPVYVLDGRMEDLREVKDEDIMIKVRRGTLNLYIPGRGSSEMHILSYTSSDSDISPAIVREAESSMGDLMKIFEKEPSKSWICCRSLPVQFVEVLLDVCDGIRKVDRINPIRLAEIIKICTDSSLRTKVGTVFSMQQFTSEAHVVDCDDLFDVMIEDMNTGIFGEVVNKMEEEVRGDNEDLEFDFEDINLFGPAHFKESSELSLVSHPLMDRFVDSAIAKMGRSAMRRLLEVGYTPTRYIHVSRLIYRAIGRNPDSIKTDDLEILQDMDISDEMIG